MEEEALINIVSQIMSGNKGILAADESTKTMEKRFEKISLTSTFEKRREWRELLFSTPNMEKFISGVILFEETLDQRTQTDVPFAKLLQDKRVVVGIKVDQGTVELPGSPMEKVTQGLDGLPQRLKNYYDKGARFTKWRAVIKVDDTLPSDFCLSENIRVLTDFAYLTQKQGMVPIVEPEILWDGDYSLDRSKEVGKNVLSLLISALKGKKVFLPGVLLKFGFVSSGKDSTYDVSPREVAESSLMVIASTLPTTIGGIVFLSGGHSPEESTTLLQNVLSMVHERSAPYKVSFSYGRALEEEALTAWSGKSENLSLAQEAFLKAAERNSKALEK